MQGAPQAPRVRRLLVLDDDAFVGVLVQNIAQLAGLDTQLTADPAAFFAVAQEWQPELLFVDLQMPTMTGEEVLRGLALRQCSGRVIISSGAGVHRLAEAAEVARSCGLALAGTLPKPFLPAALRALLASP